MNEITKEKKKHKMIRLLKDSLNQEIIGYYNHFVN